jgi:isopentenyl-diphosphate delta-isomerase
MDYYKEDQYLAKVDKNDKILGKIERWEAHREQILHRAFTACLLYKGQAILQHRKHVLFDAVFDLTCSSHPLFFDDEIEPTENAVYRAFEREWYVAQDKITSPLLNKGSAYYQANDPHSDLGEHEVCYFYTAEIDYLPEPNFEFAYGYSLVDIEKLKDPKFLAAKIFAPWVPHCIALL